MPPIDLEHRSVVPAPAATVWARVTTPEGINDELWPVLSMTMPRAFRGRTLADVAPGTHLGRSVLRLGGVVPVDCDDITIAELEPGRQFLERSSMLLLRRWEHERTLEPDESGACSVRDRITLELRGPLACVPGLGAVVRRLVGALFAHRHRRLARHFAR